MNIASSLFVSALCLLTLLHGCATPRSETPNLPTLFPAARYVQFVGTEGKYAEYIVEGEISFRDGLGNLPTATGPMRIDCSTVEEFGMIVRHANWRRGGWSHSYRFTLADENDATYQPDYFSFEKLMTGGYVRGRARFTNKPRDGVLTMSVRHRGDVLLTTQFDFVNCE